LFGDLVVDLVLVRLHCLIKLFVRSLESILRDLNSTAILGVKSRDSVCPSSVERLERSVHFVVRPHSSTRVDATPSLIQIPESPDRHVFGAGAVKELRLLTQHSALFIHHLGDLTEVREQPTHPHG
jgi:hypothetical protein